MWVLTGPFEGKREDKTEKSKLLKPGSSYTVGRKLRDFIVNFGPVANDHGTFIVASDEAPTDAESIPKLEFTQTKPRQNAYLKRGDMEPIFHLENQSNELQDGDVLYLSNEAFIRVRWIPVNIFAWNPTLKKPQLQTLTKRATTVGFKLSRVWTTRTTHILLDKTYPDRPFPTRFLYSLISGAQFVCQAWLDELLRVGEIPKGNNLSLENNFEWVDEDRFRPGGDEHRLWNPSEARKDIWSGLRFSVLSSGAPSAEFVQLVAMARATYVTHDLSSPEAPLTIEEWMDRLKADKAKAAKSSRVDGTITGNLVLIALEALHLQAQTGKDWDNIYVAGAKRMNLRMLTMDEISESLLKSDLSLLDCAIDGRSSQKEIRLPAVVPSSLPDEPTFEVAGPSRRSTRAARVVSEPPGDVLTAQESSNSNAEGSGDVLVSDTLGKPAEAPRKLPPKRRAKANLTELLGLEAPSVILEGTPDVEMTDGVTSVETRFKSPTTPATRPTRKRRAEGDVLAALGLGDGPSTQSFIGTQGGGEPPHKRFKALFEGTEQLSVEDMEEDLELSQAKSQAIPRVASQAPGRSLVSIEEDPDDIDHSSQSQTQRKTAAPSVSECGESIAGPSNMQPKIALSSTQRARSVTAKSKKGLGAEPDKPDTEPQFLQALASKKKGKRKEDGFDREFNQLRISAPDPRKEEEAKKKQDEFAAFEEYEKDMNLRGNFMRIEIIDLLRKDEGRRPALAPITLDGKPNFKKFKKKVTGNRGAKVEVELDAKLDYGVGSAYWEKDGPSASGEPVTTLKASQLTLSQMPMATARGKSTRAAAPPKKRLALTVAESEEESEVEDTIEIAKPTTSKGKGKGVASRTAVSSTRKTRKAAIPDEDEDEEQSENFDLDAVLSDDEEEVQGHQRMEIESTLKSTAASTSRGAGGRMTRGSSRAGSVVSTTGPSTQKTTRSTRVKKAAPVVVDSDSDGGMTFKGFGGRKRSRGVS